MEVDNDEEAAPEDDDDVEDEAVKYNDYEEASL